MLLTRAVKHGQLDFQPPYGALPDEMGSTLSFAKFVLLRYTFHSFRGRAFFTTTWPAPYNRFKDVSCPFTLDVQFIIRGNLS